MGNVFNIRNRPVYVKEAAGGQQQDKAGSWAAAVVLKWWRVPESGVHVYPIPLCKIWCLDLIFHASTGHGCQNSMRSYRFNFHRTVSVCHILLVFLPFPSTRFDSLVQDWVSGS